jgi:hypothetical protein
MELVADNKQKHMGWSRGGLTMSPRPRLVQTQDSLIEPEADGGGDTVADMKVWAQRS